MRLGRGTDTPGGGPGQEVAHPVVEAEKAPGAPSASWRPSKAGGGVPSWCGGQRTSGASAGGPGPSPKAKESGALTSECRRLDVPGQVKGAHLHALFLFILERTLSALDDAICLGESIFFTWSDQSNANLFQKHPHRHTEKLCCTSYLDILWPPVKTAHKINDHKALCNHTLPQREEGL